jgi:hypothetical protein
MPTGLSLSSTDRHRLDGNPSHDDTLDKPTVLMRSKLEVSLGTQPPFRVPDAARVWWNW